ncbi:MAG: DUF512 domain-containing protein [Lachnospiraceae bacterium]|nr:DUF512 domain-containing protein [Lachnospiraceae bacterium]
MRGHKIKSVEEGSIAWEMGVEPGMELVSINGQEVEDIFDYRFLMADENVDVLIREESGEETVLEIEKDADEEFGVTFESGLMDDYRSCTNHCIFCFIDQMPPGMRDTLYFKDDDSRLSFLQGNYVTLTNMSDHDIDRIIRYRMEPINVSVQTTNPALRRKMLHNRFAGDIFPKLKRLKDAGIALNGQIVLCKGWNDGEELDRTISDLTEYLPEMQSVSVVPVGLSKFRQGLTPLEPFTGEDAGHVIDQIEGWQKKIWQKLAETYVPEEGEETPDLMRGAPRHFIHASDEWYLLAGRPLPEADRYDGFIQYENGVGMLRLLQRETDAAIDRFRSANAMEKAAFGSDVPGNPIREVTIATGVLAAPFIGEIVERAEQAFSGVHAEVFPIINDFFGHMITVSGLITGQDLIFQMKEKQKAGEFLGDTLLIPVNMLRTGEEVFLDDLTITDVERELGVAVRVVHESGEDLIRALLGLPELKEDGRITYGD